MSGYKDFRDKIAAGKLRHKLQQHALGEAEMTQTQIRAAEILLKKVVPDLAAITHSGDQDNPVAVTTVQWLPPTDR